MPAPQLGEHSQTLLGCALVVVRHHRVQEALQASVQLLVPVLLVAVLDVCASKVQAREQAEEAGKGRHLLVPCLCESGQADWCMQPSSIL